MDAKKGVVTANKMLLAARAHELVKRAVERGIDLAFEASVGGGIPIIRMLARSARQRLGAIALRHRQRAPPTTSSPACARTAWLSAQALGEAQAKGYAEADPTLDIDGHDAAHKMSVLAMLAFGVKVDHGKIPTEGIRSIEPIDHRFADRFEFVIKHLAIGHDQGDRIELRVHPALVRKSSVLANVSGVLNAIYLEGRALGPCLISGRGAGDMPTAVSVVADIVDVARSQLAGAAGLSTRGISLEERPLVPLGEIETRYYLRFTGQIVRACSSRIAGALGEHGVSIEQMVQDGRSVAPSEPVPIVMITHRARESGVVAAIEAIGAVGLRHRARPACCASKRSRRGRGGPAHRPSPRPLRSACSTRGSAGSRWCARCASALPAESIVYLGDTARVPYGTRSKDTVVKYALGCSKMLIERGVKAIVVACNTVSAVALDMLRVELDLPVLGVIEPGARAAALAAGGDVIGVLGTAGTIASGAYPRAVAAVSTRAEVIGQAAPLLVPLVEEGWLEGEVPRLAVRRYLEPVLARGASVLVLGCTHYPLLAPR